MALNPKLPNEVRDAYAGGSPVLRQDVLERPLHWRKPQHVFTQGMGDLFHRSVEPCWLAEVLQIIACSNGPAEANGRILTEVDEETGKESYRTKHTFYVLTKRPDRVQTQVNEALSLAGEWAGDLAINCYGSLAEYDCLWLGVSAENQETADERIPILWQIPAAHKLLSLEPLLGDIKLDIACPDWWESGSGIEFVIAGAETGPGARPANPDWFRSLRDQCQAGGVPFWLKAVDAKGNRVLDGAEDNGRPE
jgi:protein gp37